MNEALTLTLWNAILPLAGLCALVAWLGCRGDWWGGGTCLKERLRGRWG